VVAESPQVWCVTPSSSGGWGPVTALASLTARLWETEARLTHPSKDYGVLRKVASLAPRLRGSKPPLLAIVSHPGDMLSLIESEVLLGRFSSVHVWVIDSFWAERIPRFARTRHTVDHVWVTDAELVDHYAHVMGVPCGWAPWGTDALDLAVATERSVDVLRLGRQPAAWDDDQANSASLATRGLTYAGRFPDQGNGEANQREVLRQLSSAKVVLTSGNLAGGGNYVHQTRAYISARFTDAVNCGTPIAGQFPACLAADLIPEEARVPIDVTSRHAGLDSLEAATMGWTPDLAARLHAHALETLDWRHRIRNISEAAEITTATLERELLRLERSFTVEPEALS